MLRRKALLRRLERRVDQPRLDDTYPLNTGDGILWDNRFTNHERVAFDSGSRRVLDGVHATEIQPDR